MQKSCKNFLCKNFEKDRDTAVNFAKQVNMKT